MVALSGDQGCSEGAHDACDIRTDSPAAGDPLKAAEHGVIVEGSALHHYMASKIRGICDFDYLK